MIHVRPKEHPWLWRGLLASAALQLAVIFVPVLRNLFDLAVLTAGQWLIVLAMCLVMLFFIELQKWVARR